MEGGKSITQGWRKREGVGGCCPTLALFQLYFFPRSVPRYAIVAGTDGTRWPVWGIERIDRRARILYGL